jgi:hypothetical protein
MVEIDEDLLIPDEDRIAVLLDGFLDRNLPLWNGEQSHTVTRWISAMHQDVLRKLAIDLGGSDIDPSLKVLRRGLIAHAQRRLAGPEAPLDETAEAINCLCVAYRASVSDEWNYRMGTRSVGLDASFRTLEAIGKAPGTKIMGVTTVELVDDGLVMSDVKVDGYCPGWFITRVANTAVDVLIDEGREMTLSPELESLLRRPAMATMGM